MLQFDTTFYLTTYPDVAAAISRGTIASAQDHYNNFGRFESRNPNAFFDTAFYLAQNADVAAARVNPLQHFIQFGAAEGRFANNTADSALDTNNNNRADEFNATAYLAANTDVAANVGPGKAFASAYQHYILFGQFETGRTGVPAGGPFTNSGVAPGTGSTFTLTNSAVTGSLDNLTGTNGNDTFNALGNGFLETGDAINGGNGIDTVNARFTANGQTVDPTFTNIERAFIQVDGADTKAFTFDGGDVSQELWLKNATAVSPSANDERVTFSNVALTTTVGIEGGSGGVDFAANFANVSGSSDKATLALNAANAALVTIAGVETLTVNAAAGTSTINALTTAATTTISVTGSGKVNLLDIDNVTTKVDASAATGDVNVGGVGNVNFTFTGGQGNDRVAFAAGEFTSGDVVNGGAGTDTLALADATITSGQAALITAIKATTSVEVLESTATGAITFNAADVSTINAFKVSAVNTALTAGTAANTTTQVAVAGGDAVTLSGVEAGDSLIVSGNTTGAAGGAGAATTNINGAAGGDAIQLNPLLDNGSNTATITLSGVTLTGGAGGALGASTSGTAGSGGNAINATAFETINIVSSGSTAAAVNVLAGGDAGATTGATTPIAGSAGFGIAVNTNGTINVSGANDIDLGAVSGTNATINASTLTGKLTVVGEAGNNTIIGGSAADTITGGAGIDTLTGGAGADIFKFSAGHSAATGTAFDTITDFAKASDVIDFASNITFVTNATSSSGVAAINAQGIATFNSADTTIAQQITAVEAGINAGGTAAAGQTAIWQNGSDSYVFISDGTDGVSATDVVIKLTGVTGLTTSTLTSGDLTLS